AGVADESDRIAIAEAEREAESLLWNTMVREAERMLVSAGINPAGAGPSVAQSDGERPWYRAYEPPIGGDWAPLEAETARVVRLERSRLTGVAISEAVFDRASRDLEST